MDAGQSHETFTMTSMLSDSERRREWTVGFAFSAKAGWRDAADAGVVVVGTGGAPAFFGGKGAAVSQRTKSALRKVPTFAVSKGCICQRQPLLLARYYIFPAGQRSAVRFMQSRQAARSMKRYNRKMLAAAPRPRSKIRRTTVVHVTQPNKNLSPSSLQCKQYSTP